MVNTDIPVRNCTLTTSSLFSSVEFRESKEEALLFRSSGRWGLLFFHFFFNQITASLPVAMFTGSVSLPMNWVQKS